MSDLISRSALISHIVRKYWKYGAEYNAKQIYEDVVNAPTAFDIDWVIEEIEKRKEKYKGEKKEEKFKCERDVQIGACLGLNEAIAVIRAYLCGTAEPPKTD